MAQRLTLGQFQRVIAGLEPKTEAAAIRGFRRAATYFLRTVVIEIGQAQPRAAVDTGELRNSADITVVPDGAIVSVDAPHAWIIEHGRRPGGRMPPLQAIIDWLYRHRKGLGGLIRESKKRARRSLRADAREARKLVGAAYAKKAIASAVEEKAMRAAAFVIARGIQKNGIAPRHYFRKAWDRSVPYMAQLVSLEIAKVGWNAKPSAIKKIELALKGAAK